MCAKVPRYIEIYSNLRLAILNNQYLPGSFLPTENELMEQFNASKTTIRHAVQLLREQGLVDVRQGSGTRITAMEQKTVTGKKYNLPDSETSVHVRYLTDGSGEVHNTKAVFDLVPAPPSAAKVLGVPVGSEIYRLQRLQLADGVPFGYMVNYLSPVTFPDLSSKGELLTDLYGFLNKHFGVMVDQIEETIDTINAGFMESQFLQTDIGVPLLLLKRTASGNGKVVEYCETTIRPDIFQMTIQLVSRGSSSAFAFYPPAEVCP